MSRSGFTFLLAVVCLARPVEARDLQAGLVGTFYQDSDFSRPDDETDTLRSVDHSWGTDRGSDWSARWAGFIAAPDK